jgi:mono/diheme cytochrome c family protein
MPDEPIRQEVVTADAVRLGYVLGTLGMVGLIVGIFLLTSVRPQGRVQRLDDSQHRATLQEAEARLTGFAVDENGAARLDIAHAMNLVVERGVGLQIVAGGVAPERPAPPLDPEAGAAPAAIEGEPVYAANCAACHQATGRGIPRAFPPLAGHVADLYAADRDYLPLVVLYGLQGAIEVDGVPYAGLMPAFPRLSDYDIAALLNHVMEAWGAAAELGDAYEPYTEADIEALRGEGLRPADVHERRQQLTLP